jgi:TonB family protein
MYTRHATALALTLAALASRSAIAQQTAAPHWAGTACQTVPRWCRRASTLSTASPTFLPKLELARCYDLAWRMADVEPAILNALAALRVEVRTGQVTAAPNQAAAVAGIDVPLPSRMTEIPPEYPAKAFLDGVTGVVIVEALIDKDGRVKQARAAESVPGLDEAAVQAVKRWRFIRRTERAARRGGHLRAR